MSQTTYSVLYEFGIGPCGIKAAGVHFAEVLHQMADLILTLRAERDKLRDQWSDLLIEQTRLMAMRDEAVQKRDDAIAERDEARRDAISAWAEYAGEKETSAQCLSYLRQSEDMVDSLTAERDAQHATYTALHDALIVAEGQRDQLRAERDALKQRAEAAEARAKEAERVITAAKAWLDVRHGPLGVSHGAAQRALAYAVSALVALEGQS